MEQLQRNMVWLMNGMLRMAADAEVVHLYDRRHRVLVRLDGADGVPEAVLPKLDAVRDRRANGDEDLIAVPPMEEEDLIDLMADFIELTVDRKAKRQMDANLKAMRSVKEYSLSGLLEGIGDERIRQEWAMSVQGTLEVMAAQFAEEHGIELESVEVLPPEAGAAGSETDAEADAPGADGSGDDAGAAGESDGETGADTAASVSGDDETAADGDPPRDI